MRARTVPPVRRDARRGDRTVRGSSSGAALPSRWQVEAAHPAGNPARVGAPHMVRCAPRRAGGRRGGREARCGRAPSLPSAATHVVATARCVVRRPVRRCQLRGRLKRRTQRSTRHGLAHRARCEGAPHRASAQARKPPRERPSARARRPPASTGCERAGRTPGSVPPQAAVTAISLGPTLPSASSGLPEDSASSLSVLCLTLLRARFTERIRSPGPLVVSYTTVSPLPTSPPAVCFLWHCLADCSGWVLPTALLCGARTFLGTPGGVTRPSHRPVRDDESSGHGRRGRPNCCPAETRTAPRATSTRSARRVVRRRRPGAPTPTPTCQALFAARVAAPMMPALFRSVAGMMSACRSSSGRNSSYCFDTPPPTTKSSGESRASSVE